MEAKEIKEILSNLEVKMNKILNELKELDGEILSSLGEEEDSEDTVKYFIEIAVANMTEATEAVEEANVKMKEYFGS